MQRFNSFILLMALSFLFSCSSSSDRQFGGIGAEATRIDTTGHLIHDYPPTVPGGLINVVVEIPTGTLAKWEVEHDTGELTLEKRNGSPRQVNYLAYPGNYGMVPGTMPYEGKGDPIDVLILGPAVERGAIVQCKLIGMLELLDRGRQDDKLIVVRANTIFSDIDGMEELDAKFSGISDIILIWFENYKGRGKIEVISYRDREIAEEVLNSAIRGYEEDYNGVIEEEEN